MDPIQSTGTVNWDSVSDVHRFVGSNNMPWFYVGLNDAREWVCVRIVNPALQQQYLGSGIKCMHDGRLDVVELRSLDTSFAPDVVAAVKYEIERRLRLREEPGARIEDLGYKAS